MSLASTNKSPERFKTVAEYLDIIGWTPAVMSERCNISVRAIRRWANGQNQTPDRILVWLHELASAHERIVLQPSPHPVSDNGEQNG